MYMNKLTLNKFISVILCGGLILCLFPTGLVTTFAENTSVSIGKGQNTADKGNINGWKEYLNTTMLDTSESNRIWTDKSVFTSAEEYKAMQAIPAGSSNTAYNTLATNNQNFLIALSAMASSIEITGYAGTPTDTVLILDLSQSMDNSQYIPTLVTAANNAITSLQNQNSHNRISVVLYSGNTSTNTKANLNNATTLLPLDRYTAGNDGKFLNYSGQSNNTTVNS